MRRFILLSLLLFALLLIFIPDTSGPWDHTSNTNPGDQARGLAGAWYAFQQLITAIRDALYLFAELTLALLNKCWDATPPRYKVLYGVLFAGTNIMAVAGLLSLGTARGLLKRLLG